MTYLVFLEQELECLEFLLFWNMKINIEMEHMNIRHGQGGYIAKIPLRNFFLKIPP